MDSNHDFWVEIHPPDLSQCFGDGPVPADTGLHTGVARSDYLFHLLPREFDGNNEQQTEDTSTQWVPRFSEDAGGCTHAPRGNSLHMGCPVHPCGVRGGERGSPCANSGS